jgi:hypothetical protein
MNHPARGPVHFSGIDGHTNAANRRRSDDYSTARRSESAA